MNLRDLRNKIETGDVVLLKYQNIPQLLVYVSFAQCVQGNNFYRNYEVVFQIECINDVYRAKELGTLDVGEFFGVFVVRVIGDSELILDRRFPEVSFDSIEKIPFEQLETAKLLFEI